MYATFTNFQVAKSHLLCAFFVSTFVPSNFKLNGDDAECPKDICREE